MVKRNKVKIDFSRLKEMVNKAYQDYFFDFRRFQIYKGGAGAGKSVSISQKISYHAAATIGYNTMILRKIGRDNHDSTFAEIQKAIKSFGTISELYKINLSRGAEEITFIPNGNKIIFRGLDDVEKIKSVTFPTGDLVCVWIEEASEISEDDFNQINLRLRGLGKIPKHVIMSFNPVSADIWIKKRFFDYPLKNDDGFILETNYLDNEFIDEIYKQELEGYQQKDQYYYQVYVLNQWGERTTSNVFHNIQVHDFDIPLHNMENIRHGMDFGYNHANTLMGSGYVDGELYIFYEYYAKKQLNHEFIEAVERDEDYDKDYPITAESAEPDKIAEWNAADFDVYAAKKGPGSLKMGIDYLKQLPAIHIHATNCPNAAREFLKFKYRELKDGRILDEYVEIDDDTIAGIRYGNEDMIDTGEENQFFIKRRRR